MSLNPLILVYNEVIYRPFLNGLILIYGFLPIQDMGIAIILFTIIIRLLIYPLSHYGLKAQKKMAVLHPKIKEIQDKYKNNKEEQSRRTMELYKEHKTNPFSGCLLLILQIPVFIALFQVFRYGFDTSSFSYLYSFVPRPDSINPFFLGIIDVTEKSIFLALLVGISQYVQAMTMPQPQAIAGGDKPSFANEFQRAMHTNTKYMLPIFMAFVSYSLPSALSLYFTISNVFVILQQMIINRKN